MVENVHGRRQGVRRRSSKRHWLSWDLGVQDRVFNMFDNIVDLFGRRTLDKSSNITKAHIVEPNRDCLLLQRLDTSGDVTTENVVDPPGERIEQSWRGSTTWNP